MNVFKKSVAVLATATMLAIAGCGASSDEPTTGTGDGEEATTISYWSMWQESEPQAAILKSAAADFNAATGNTVEIEWQGRDVMTKVAPLLRSGDVPDLVDQALDKIGPVLGSTGQAADLSSVLDAEAEGVEGKLGAAGVDKYRDLSTMDGNLVMIPYQATGVSLWFDENTVPELAEAPATLDDLANALAAMKKRSGTAPIAIDGDYPFARLLWVMETLRAKLGSAQAVRDLAGDETGATWDDPKVKEAIEWVADLHTNGMFLPKSFGTKWPAQQEAFAAGNGQSVMLGGSWFPVEVAKSTPETTKWATVPMPSGADNIEVPVSFFGFAVPSKSKNVDVAKDFIAFFLASKYQEKLVKDADVLPILSSVEAPESLKGIADALAEGQPVIVNAGIDIAYPQWMQLIKDNSTDLLTGSDDAQTFIDKCKAAQIAYWQQNA